MSNKTALLNFPRSRCRQNGAAMMEMVVSLFVLAIGLMGTLSMQINGVNSNQRAHFVTDANVLATDMVDRIMAYNSGDITEDNDDYNGIYSADIGTADASGCIATGCNAAAQKSLDAWEWSQAIKARLPSGTGEVIHASGVYTVVLKWSQGDAFVNATCSNIKASALKDTDATKACLAYQLRL
ncbi:type IV pilus modification protein PilV [Teredinibacter purpureus]|uniref:type IV pilus modification protein PilV n=1 Tax=Teredinibacter purpureus TaxID=2731756 RepID=UPI000697BB18|nr:type IV pilus modification protein PilV [Teredinibacter purpureus]